MIAAPTQTSGPGPPGNRVPDSTAGGSGGGGGGGAHPAAIFALLVVVASVAALTVVKGLGLPMQSNAAALLDSIGGFEQINAMIGVAAALGVGLTARSRTLSARLTAIAVASAVVLTTIVVAVGFVESKADDRVGPGTAGDPVLKRLYAGLIAESGQCQQNSNIPEFGRQSGLWVDPQVPFTAMIKCQSEDYSAYFVTAHDAQTRGDLFGSAWQRKDGQNCDSWDGPNTPSPESVKARVCYRAGDGVSPAIYWEAAADNRESFANTAGVLISHRLPSTDLERLWRDTH
ncbi:hypothetical protein [Actinoplanes sp. ATCC 53533]|uniref:hypothetical protein n=1 Tax=Actinoplanes sp. ATCC 53533 TaxID=1288362 RepID=UPI000F7A35CF|nr:hypothetical protein [Actinoplanes sp. ATCC 53533]